MIIENDIGQVVLQPNQISRISTLNSGTILGFFCSDLSTMNWIVKSDHTLTQTEIDSVKTAMLGLSNSAPQSEQDKTDYTTSPFKNLTPDQADTWIQNNVTDLASAKIALRRIVKVLIYLVRRSDL